MATFESSAAVVGLVGEAVRAVVVGGRRVGERAVGVQRQRAVRRAADQDRRQRVAVRRRCRCPARPGAATVSGVSSLVL